MKLSLICIKRPVFATVLSLLVMVFGIIGYVHLELRYFPDIPQKFAEVGVRYAGASPSLMQNTVTTYLENALINVRGVTSMTSRSTYNHSYIDLQFDPDSNMVEEMGLVRDAVSGQIQNLPADSETPTITSGGVSDPVLNLGFMDKNLKPAEIRDYLVQSIQPKLQNLPGVGAIWLYGASTYAMRIWLDPQKMAALGVTGTDIQSVLQSNNIDFSGGSIQGHNRNFSLVASTRLNTAKEFQNLIVRDDNGNVVKLGDVAKVELGSQSLEDSPMRINGKNAVDMEIRPLVSANPITVAKEVKAVLKQIQKDLPKDMTMQVTWDQSLFLHAAINESFMTLFEAIFLVVLVVILFLGSIRAAIVPIVTIPVCVVGVFGVMLLFSFSLNVMTLLAIILAIGLVVDDAIVMLENIHRHIETGETPMQAAIRGSREIGFAVIAMTLTLAAVYAPTGFATGFSAGVFKEFAFSLAGAVLISGFVALTLSPMMCSRILMPKQEENPYQKCLTRYFEGLNRGYQALLGKLMNYRWWVVASLMVIAGLGYFVYQSVPQAFIPKEDLGYFTADISGPSGSNIDYTNRYMQSLDQIYADTPDILSYASFIDAGSGVNFVTLKPFTERKLTTEQVLSQIFPKLNGIPGITVTPQIPDPVQYTEDSTGKSMQVQVMTLGSYLDLEKTLERLEAILKTYPGLQSVDSSLKFNNQVYEVRFDRDEAAALGVNLQDVADTVSIMMSGKHITDMLQGNQTYQVRVQMSLKDLESFSGLSHIYVRSSSGAMVPLSNLVTLTPAVRQSELTRYSRMNSATLSADIAPGFGQDEILKHVESVLDSNLSPQESYAFTGRMLAFIQSQGTMFGLFLMSLIFIYLVLAAQFESFVDPFIILLAVPLCIVGAMATLKVTGGSLNLYTNIGLITLVGLITKHGIMITQFANVRFQEGENLRDAVINAAVIRLRPILMTTFAMVLGAVPLALATGPGSVSHSQIGWTIVGGMTSGTFFSLIVVPVAYFLLARFDHRKKLLIQERVGKG